MLLRSVTDVEEEISTLIIHEPEVQCETHSKTISEKKNIYMHTFIKTIITRIYVGIIYTGYN